MEDATHSPSVFSQGLTRRPPGRISNGSPGYWPCVAREGVEARISPKSVPCTDLAICWGAFVGWDAIFDFRSSIRSTDLGKHQCFRAEFQAASIPLKYHGVRLFSYDFKECHAWYHPGTPPKKPSLKLMFIETSIFHVKVLNHSIKTTIYKWMFQVPGWYLIFQLWVLYSPPPVFPSTLLEQSQEEPHALASHPQHDGSMQMFLFGNAVRTCLGSHEVCDLFRCKVLCPTLEIFVPNLPGAEDRKLPRVRRHQKVEPDECRMVIDRVLPVLWGVTTAQT